MNKSIKSGASSWFSTRNIARCTGNKTLNFNTNNVWVIPLCTYNKVLHHQISHPFVSFVCNYTAGCIAMLEGPHTARRSHLAHCWFRKYVAYPAPYSMGNVGKVVWHENDHHSLPSSVEVCVDIYTFSQQRLHPVLNPLNAELNPICHLLALLGSATVVVVSRLRVNGAYRI
jgi:hypothetical protein